MRIMRDHNSAVRGRGPERSVLAMEDEAQVCDAAKKERPTHFPLLVEREDRQERVDLPIEEYPSALFLLNFKIPAHLDGRPYDRGIEIIGVTTRIDTTAPALKELATKLGTGTISFQSTHSTGFARLLAKMAHGIRSLGVRLRCYRAGLRRPRDLGHLR
jgi:hypothetical protein